MPDNVSQFLIEIGLGKYAEIFAENEIDLETLGYLTEDDFRELGLPLGPRRKLSVAINRINASQPATTWSELKSSPAKVSNNAERRHLTVMFCDMVGSTELSTTMDPEDLRELIARYQDTISICVSKYDGHIAKFLGDGVLAYFGWPIAHEDQAERAVRAGLECVSAVTSIQDQSGEALAARVGIATGQVIVGDLVGSLAEDSQAVVGETPNLAARLQGVAQPGQVVVGENTKRLLGTTFEYLDLGQQELKGFATQVLAFQVLKESSAESRFEAKHSNDLGRHVGREYEIDLILERWRRAQAGQGQVVLLSAEAGYGKSRMIQAVRGLIHETNPYYIGYQCSPLHSGTAFYPVARRLSRDAGFADNDNSVNRSKKLKRLLIEKYNVPIEHIPLYAALLALPIDGQQNGIDLDPAQLRRATIKALIDQIVSASAITPVLLVVEDAHWLDPTSEDLIGEIVAKISNLPMILLITQRPEYNAPWRGQRNVTSVVLNSLDDSQAAEIVHDIAADSLPPSLIEKIIERSGGVPLYLEELTKSILEASFDGITLEDDVIPESLQASMLGRLDRLGVSKEIAQIGAVIGREFSFSLIEAVTHKPADEIHGLLNALVASELVFKTGLDKDIRYVFKHALIQDAAYDSLLMSRRKELHSSICLAMEGIWEGQLEEHIEALAYHAQRAELWEKALGYCLRAGKRANERSAHHEALYFLEAGLSAAQQLEQSPEVKRQIIEIYMSLRPSLGSFGHYERQLDILTKANELASSIKDQRTATLANVVKSHVLFHSGQLDEGLKTNETAVRSARQIDDLPLLVTATQNLAMGNFFSGNFRRAVEHSLEYIDTAKNEFRHQNLGTTGTSSVNWLGNLCGMHCALGEFDLAHACIEESLQIADEVGKPFDFCMAKQWQGHYLISKGEFGLAVDVLETTKALIEEHDLEFIRAWAGGWYGDALMRVGRLAEAEKVIQEADVVAANRGLEITRIWGLIRIVYIKLEQLDAVRALETAKSSVALAQKTKSRWLEVLAMRQLANSMSQAGHIKDAAACYEKTKRLAKDMDAKPEISNIHWDYGLHLERTGDIESALSEFELAKQLKIEMNMVISM